MYHCVGYTQYYRKSGYCENASPLLLPPAGAAAAGALLEPHLVQPGHHVFDGRLGKAAKLEQHLRVPWNVGLVGVKLACGRYHNACLPRPAYNLGFAQAGAGGFFDDAGFPAGQGWDLIELPARSTENAYALEVQGDSMLPLYRHGDVLIVDPGAQVRGGDRVVVKTHGGEVMAKVLHRQSPRSIELVSLNPEHPNRNFDIDEVDWIARIIWASQ